jgi:hypothetical protein
MQKSARIEENIMSHKGYLTIHTYEISDANFVVYKDKYENIPFHEFAVNESFNFQDLNSMDDADVGFALSQVRNSHFIYLILTPVTGHQSFMGTMAMKKSAGEKSRMHIFITIEKTAGHKSSGAIAVTDADATVKSIFTTPDSTVVTFNLPVAHVYRGATENHLINPLTSKSMD